MLLSLYLGYDGSTMYSLKAADEALTLGMRECRSLVRQVTRVRAPISDRRSGKPYL